MLDALVFGIGGLFCCCIGSKCCRVQDADVVKIHPAPKIHLASKEYTELSPYEREIYAAHMNVYGGGNR